MARKWSLLSITDLHYECLANYLDDNKEAAGTPFRERVFGNFDNILKRGFGHPPREFDLVAVCGDITTKGEPKGLDRFKRDAIPLLDKLVSRREAICVVPGNHDVKWGIGPTEKKSFDRKFASFVEMIDETGVTSCFYPSGEDHGDENLALSSRRGPVFRDSDRKILVACINSSMRCGELDGEMQIEIGEPTKKAIDDLQAAGHTKASATLKALQKGLHKYSLRDVAQVTQDQLNRLSAEIEKEKEKIEDWSAYLRVAILHHHLIQFPGQITEQRGYALLLDSAKVLDTLLEYDFDLVLTGHKHQPYEFIYTVGRRHLLLVGGPTVGGEAAGDAFRGFRHINVEDAGNGRLFQIYDLRHQFGEGNPAARVAESLAKPIRLFRSPRPGHERRVLERGFSYRAITAITRLQDDGDATRIVECDDFVVKSECSRRYEHELHLPQTSGYLADFKATGNAANRHFYIHVKNGMPNPREKRVQTWNPKLGFDGIYLENPVSYTYQWRVLEGFAMDKEQFAHMCEDGNLDNIEFTHFMTEDPVEELTIVVQFPPNFRPEGSPALRIAHADGTLDARKWTLDDIAKHDLVSEHALRYYDSLNIAALRVRYPRPDLSYGIQWEVPSAPPQDPEVTRAAETLVQQLQLPSDELRREAMRKMLKEVIQATRNTFLSEWGKPIQASLMYFDLDRHLPLIIAGVQSGDAEKIKELNYKGALEYGEGVAGRAFKGNRMRVYVFNANDKTEFDLYTQLPGGPRHKVMVSLPVHIPVEENAFDRDPKVYECRRPYGVINIGSEDKDCPLSELRLPERIPSVMEFQHALNALIYQHLTGAISTSSDE